MDKKVIKYLATVDSADYSVLDKILQLYVDGNIAQWLGESHLNNVEMFAHISNKGNALQISATYYNMFVNVELVADKAAYSVTVAGITAEQFEQSFVTVPYDDGFDMQQLLDNVSQLAYSDSRVNKQQHIEKQAKHKIWRNISRVCIAAMILVFPAVIIFFDTVKSHSSVAAGIIAGIVVFYLISSQIADRFK